MNSYRYYVEDKKIKKIEIYSMNVQNLIKFNYV